ncbi:hypothetical protein CLOSTASPAR_04423 [[Clostridium] asparagiforme DSM 15981]|uniref:Uncharacterized protein n=1 Tax=[Clostridium] asparagiforme DSM 15981 TaxID=518636 RepID=C0D577_9FIRM|nr:hypothetical protein CLOSTASPAR_04423 [[Clostridium] asparagiforme DSM 15981]
MQKNASRKAGISDADCSFFIKEKEIHWGNLSAKMERKGCT